ncbi:hypothetical protein PG985_007857 [Apiospora marii]|uniref:uncharacterized protein n=1 Tax=Apiospora marii TaxID=335849 RepID=UPI00312EFD66
MYTPPTNTSQVASSAPQPVNNAEDNGGVTIELPYPATSLVIAQCFGYIRRTRTWAAFLCASFYDADDNELWHTEILIGSQLNYNRAAEHLFGSDPDNTNFSPSHNRLHNSFSSLRAHHANIIDPDTFSAPDPNNNNGTIIFPNPRHLAVVNTPVQAPAQRPYSALGRQQHPQRPLALNSFTFNFDPQYPQFPPRNNNSNALTMSGGWNPRAGWDSGNANGGGAAPNNNGFYSLPPGYNPANSIPMYSYPQPMPGQSFAQGPVYTMPQNGFQHPVPAFQEQQHDPRFLHPHPVVTADSAALNFQNSTGGVGCEPGYNYYFPQQHTKLHVIKSKEPPWRLAAGMSMHFGAYHVPTNTTLGDIMKGFGATNAESKKNRITEVNPGGNGNWYKGMTFTGDDKDKMALTLKELGWDHTRSGRTGEKPVVWIWVTNT